MTLDASSVSEDLIGRLRASYDEGEIVEIAAMAGLFNYFNRMAEALQIEPTKPGEGL
jgi:alkylhydroperoxidase family enzyme